MVEPHTIGWRLKKLRREKGEREGRSVTQPVAASESTVPQASLAKYETNGMRPQGDNLLKLARYYEVEPEAILNGTTAQPNLTLVPDPEAHDAASELYLSEDYVRRVCGKLQGQKQSILAVIQVTETEHVENGLAIPAWLGRIRREHGL